MPSQRKQKARVMARALGRRRSGVTEELRGLVRLSLQKGLPLNAEERGTWAQLSAAVLEARLTTAEVLQLLGHTPLAEHVLTRLLIGSHKHRGAHAVVEQHARNEAAVLVGRRSAESLLAFPKEMFVGTELTFNTPEKSGEGW